MSSSSSSRRVGLRSRGETSGVSQNRKATLSMDELRSLTISSSSDTVRNKDRTPSSRTRNTPSRSQRTPKTATPLARRIHQQILSGECMASSSTRSDSVQKDNKSQSRLAQLAKHQHILNARKSPRRLLSPLANTGTIDERETGSRTNPCRTPSLSSRTSTTSASSSSSTKSSFFSNSLPTPRTTTPKKTVIRTPREISRSRFSVSSTKEVLRPDTPGANLSKSILKSSVYRNRSTEAEISVKDRRRPPRRSISFQSPLVDEENMADSRSVVEEDRNESASTRTSCDENALLSVTRTPPVDSYCSSRTPERHKLSSLRRNNDHTTPTKRNSTPSRPTNPKRTPKSSQSSRRTPLSANKRSTPASIDTGPSTRRNLDKRTARLTYSNEFAAAIEECRQNTNEQLPAGSPTSKSRMVYVRKRPIFPQELEQGDFDVVGVEPGVVTLYKTSMQADMKTKTVQPVRFPFVGFDEMATNQDVYQTVGQPLVDQALDGHTTTLLMFGQTGSGKTYTMQGLQEQIAEDLLGDHAPLARSLLLQHVELVGGKCQDLIGTALVKIMDNKDGSVELLHASSLVVDTPGSLLHALQDAHSRRATQSTCRNDGSSRSHAVCQISIYEHDVFVGRILLVDAAGTERRNDSLRHSQKRQAESVEINESLYALKECLRACNLRKYIPYRTSLLTRILRQGLESNRLAIVATVAPNGTDLEHSLSTLEAVAKMNGDEPEYGKTMQIKTKVTDQRSTAPKAWKHSDLVHWMRRKRLLREEEPDPPTHVDGRFLMRCNKIQLRNLIYNDEEWKRADLLYGLLRAETDRVARLDLKRRIQSKNAGSGVL